MRSNRRIVLTMAVLVASTALPGAVAQDKGIGVAPVDKSAAPRPYPKMHALCIGINDYASSGVPDLSYAEADASGLADILTQLYGFDDVRLLTGHDASRRGISDAIADLYDPGRVGEDDAVIIYFSGHGATIRQGQSEVGYLIPQNADLSLNNAANPAAYRRHALRMDDLRTDAEGIPAKHVLFLIDSCYSGYLSSKSLDAPPAIINALKYRARQVITAGTAGEEAVEHNAWRHGAFTYKLLEILQAEERPLQASALGVMLKDRVPRAVLAKFGPDRSLSPQAKYLSGEGDFLFLRPGALLKPASPDRTATTPRSGTDFLSALRLGDQKVIENLVAAGDFSAAMAKLTDYETTWETDRFAEQLKKLLASRLTPRPQPPVVPANDNVLTVDLGGGVSMDLVLIPAGEFLMGSPETEEGRDDDEGPQHRVRISKPFYMGKYEVTQSQWQAVMGQNPSSFKDCGGDCPVERVSWDDCQSFCRKLSQRVGREIRLPSESEWEYACRAGTSSPFYFGDTISTDQANYDGNGTYGHGRKGVYREKTTSVGSFAANDFGLYDMHGNVWEWCEDKWHDSYNGAPTDGSAWTAGNSESRVLRGGSWHYFPQNCRSAVATGASSGSRDRFIGFRVAVGT